MIGIGEQASRTIKDRIKLLKELTDGVFKSRAIQYDEEYSFPKKNFEDLLELGLLGATISTEYGGLGISSFAGNIRDLWTITTEVAKADMAMARCFEGHNNAMMLINNLATANQKKKWFKGVLQFGEIWSVWSGEPLLKKPGQSKSIGTNLKEVQDGYIVNGSKVFCSSAPGAEWAILLVNKDGAGAARHAEGNPNSVIMLACDMSNESITLDDSWWKPVGMRASVSYKVNFNNTFIPKENVIGEPGQFLNEEWQTRWVPQYASTFLGGAIAAYNYTLDYVKIQNRQADPYVQHRIAKMEINIQSATQWLDQAAIFWSEKQVEKAIHQGNMVRYQIEQLATETVQHAIHICGARSLIKPSPIEKILRDLTIYARHDNADHVLATIGKSVLGSSHDKSFYKSSS